MNIHEMPGIFPLSMEPVAPVFRPAEVVNFVAARNQAFREKALPQNHSSRDRSPMQRMVSPTNRNRHGNKR